MTCAGADNIVAAVIGQCSRAGEGRDDIRLSTRYPCLDFMIFLLFPLAIPGVPVDVLRPSEPDLRSRNTRRIR